MHACLQPERSNRLLTLFSSPRLLLTEKVYQVFGWKWHNAVLREIRAGINQSLVNSCGCQVPFNYSSAHILAAVDFDLSHDIQNSPAAHVLSISKFRISTSALVDSRYHGVIISTVIHNRRLVGLSQYVREHQQKI